MRVAAVLCLMAAPLLAGTEDRPCLISHMCAMTAPCIPQEQAITVRVDVETGRVQFGLNGRAPDLAVAQRSDEGVLVARSGSDQPVEYAQLSVFPDGTMVYTAHLINQVGTGLSLSVMGRCQPPE